MCGTLHDLLARLISSLFSHGYVPDQLRLSTILPIVKNKQASLNMSSNYRGIALTSILSKLIDILIIEFQSNALTSSDLQFGFKEKSSTVQCTFVVQEVVNYYVRNDSNVYCTFLDASKAFDRVHYNKLFAQLSEKKMCPMVIRFLCFMYTKQKCRVKWESSISESFEVSNGVKQGGVLSPLLFNVYIDVLLTRLRSKGLGCFIGNNYFGAVAYADDVVLLSPTVSNLKSMLKICEEFSKEFHINFNASKSKLIIFGECTSDVKVYLQGNLISLVSTEKHVGNIVGNDPDTMSQSVHVACNHLYGKLNFLINQIGACRSHIMYLLFKNYCMSLYGCQLWNYSLLKQVKPVYIAWRKCVRRIFKLPRNTHSALLYYLCEDGCIDVQLHRRFLKFILSIINSANYNVKFLSRLVVNGSQSSSCESLNYMCYRYNIDQYNVTGKAIVKIVMSHDDALEQKSSLISDLIKYRDDNPCDDQVVELINELATE